MVGLLIDKKVFSEQEIQGAISAIYNSIKKQQTGYMINLKIKQKHDRRFSQIRNSGTLVEKFLLYVMIKIKKYLLK